MTALTGGADQHGERGRVATVAPGRFGPRAVADLVAPAIEDACRKRGFAAAEVVTLWRELVDPGTAAAATPQRIDWPRRAAPDTPGTLVLAADAGAAIFLAHSGPEIAERVNAFLGWRAIAKVKVVARLHPPPPPRRPPPEPDPAMMRRVRAVLADAGDGPLAAALARLGGAVARGVAAAAQNRPISPALTRSPSPTPAARPNDRTGEVP